jgi:[ribosomal protein S5]-alanine N-acetyltransferase
VHSESAKELKPHRIYASHFHHNPISGKILSKLGMRYEGYQRQHYLKWDQFFDSELDGLLREEWKTSKEVLERKTEK